jgi:hypothetical protein
VRAGEHQASEGSGLGLSLCKDFIEKGHNGFIGFTSKPGSGSTFYFEIDFQISTTVPATPNLPTAQRRASYSSFKSEIVSQQSTESSVDVLIVDDSAMTRKLLSKTLDSLGVKYATCENGRQAVDQLTNNRISCSIVFMDKEVRILLSIVFRLFFF